MEIASSIPPDKLFKALVLDNDNLIQKLMPKAINNVQVLEGDLGLEPSEKSYSAKVCSIHKTQVNVVKLPNFNCVYAVSQFNYVKHMIEGIDTDNLIYRYSVIEGDAVMNVLEKISNEIKFEASADGGCICKNSSTYYTIGDFELSKEEIRAGKQNPWQFSRLLKTLLDNPDAY
ncbi:major allergen Pru ar 1 [Ricinus communis]|uniref:major allergen Pru ar 1 n=1 Tax=Ricinus communis TaxID=3988 RepID=UPI00201AD4FE|nr:major allergen Pru ar 1 [Ricinus communis]